MAAKEAVEEVKINEELPVIPLKELVVFPYLVVPLLVGRPKSVEALEEAMRTDHVVFLVAQKQQVSEDAEPEPEDLYQIGTAATILQVLRLPDGTARALVEGLARGRIAKVLKNDQYLKARVEQLVSPVERRKEKTIELEALMRNAVNEFERAAQLGKPIPSEVIVAALNIDEPGRLADFIAFHLSLKTSERQEILEAADAAARLEKVVDFVTREIEILEVGGKIRNKVEERLGKTQREYFLREQMKAIQEELGGEGGVSEMEDLAAKVEEAGMTAEAKEKALKEVDRLSKMSPVSAEAPVIRTYLDWLIGLPWQKTSREKLDIKRAEKILNEDHYGLYMVKERVLEFLAVHKLNKKTKGPILCFVGPPGVGKTSIGKSIARALGRKFIRMSLGGIRDEAEIRGHRRTYVGALPGRIIQSIHQVGTKNPVFMLDEIDKVGADFRGDPTAALLEALDPEQNNVFSDHYLETPFDLSDVMFITTANLLDPIPPALRDRMEVISFPGYTDDEKLNIADKFLVPKQLKEHGIKQARLKVSKDALVDVVREYTREAGVRNLEREIATICRKTARDIVEGKKATVRVTKKNLSKFIGVPRFKYGMAEEKDQIGVATALAWTEVGGDILTVEATTMKGRGNLTLTGQLGEVMQESAQAALSYTRANAEKFKIPQKYFSDYDMHIHVPAGAIPKDGPSAGITIAVAMISALTGRPVKKEVAMTGEITLRGRVLPIGGIKEKSLAAHRAGIKEIVLPSENEKDLEEIPKHVIKDLAFKFVETMDEVIKLTLDKPVKPKSAKKS
ncbi:MAG: endopeptidase La [Actinomycetota bacterium]